MKFIYNDLEVFKNIKNIKNKEQIYQALLSGVSVKELPHRAYKLDREKFIILDDEDIIVQVILDERVEFINKVFNLIEFAKKQDLDDSDVRLFIDNHITKKERKKLTDKIFNNLLKNYNIINQ